MTPLSADDLARLRELDGKATRRPWSAPKEKYSSAAVYGDHGDVIAAFTACYPSGATSMDDDDAALIAAARNALPDLLDTVDQLRSLLAEARDATVSAGRTAFTPSRLHGKPICAACDEYASPLSPALIARIDAALSAEPASTD